MLPFKSLPCPKDGQPIGQLSQRGIVDRESEGSPEVRVCSASEPERSAIAKRSSKRELTSFYKLKSKKMLQMTKPFSDI